MACWPSIAGMVPGVERVPPDPEESKKSSLVLSDAARTRELLALFHVRALSWK